MSELCPLLQFFLDQSSAIIHHNGPAFQLIHVTTNRQTQKISSGWGGGVLATFF